MIGVALPRIGAYLHRVEADNRIQLIKNLQPDTTIPVFHGTDLTRAAEFCTNGIDARTPVPRLYPHYIRGPDGKNHMVNRGLFVAPDSETCTHFGTVVLKMIVRGKNLFPMFPHPERMRSDRKLWADKYPGSFRPDVSESLLKGIGRSNSGHQWNDGKDYEKQALLRGTVSPRQIVKVFLMEYDPRDGSHKPGRYGHFRWSGAPAEFLAWIAARRKEGKTKDRVRDFVFEPQERPTADEFFARFDKKWPGKGDLIRELAEDGLREGETFQAQVQRIRDLPGSQVMPDTVAKWATRALLKHFGIAQAPGAAHETQTYETGR